MSDIPLSKDALKDTTTISEAEPITVAAALKGVIM